MGKIAAQNLEIADRGGLGAGRCTDRFMITVSIALNGVALCDLARLQGEADAAVW